MEAHDWAFIAAGGIGCTVSVIHGLLTHKLMTKPALANAPYPDNIRRLVPLLLQFSTFCWFFGGLAVIAAPFFLSVPQTLVTAAFVGVFYAFGALGNLWGTRGRHPGWILLVIAVALILYGSVIIAK